MPTAAIHSSAPVRLTVVDALEDAEDYAAFEMSITAGYDAQSAVERELVLKRDVYPQSGINAL